MVLKEEPSTNLTLRKNSMDRGVDDASAMIID